jgi:hypothetical protein
VVAARLGGELAGGVNAVAEDGVFSHKGAGGADVRHGRVAGGARLVELMRRGRERVEGEGVGRRRTGRRWRWGWREEEV